MKNSLIQPYFVMSTFKYYKAVVGYLGISHFYAFVKENIDCHDMIAVPDGCIDILFKCDETAPFAEVCGSVLQAKKVLTNNTSYYFGVRFYPGGGYNYKNIKIGEIIDHQIPLTDVLDSKDMIEKITSTKDFNKQIHIFMEHYIHSLALISTIENKKSMKYYMLNRIITTQGNIKIKDLAIEINYSERYVNMKFIEYYGIRPKVFSRIIRFQHVLNSLNNSKCSLGDESLIQIANEAGYYDQSHMTKDFSLLSSNTPSKYLTLLKKSDYQKRIVKI